ncbi:MAG: hypothetical protein J7545_09170, partial [Roseofilum sp. SBFL]|uniref:hypothetical protein n=1 Tax=Roseofilum sp. SBFL TaxID=2821496 RepID=UPI001B1C9DAB
RLTESLLQQSELRVSGVGTLHPLSILFFSSLLVLLFYPSFGRVTKEGYLWGEDRRSRSPIP